MVKSWIGHEEGIRFESPYSRVKYYDVIMHSK